MVVTAEKDTLLEIHGHCYDLLTQLCVVFESLVIYEIHHK